MTTQIASAGLYREPGTPARLFVYGFAALSPLLTLGLIVVPAAVSVRMEGAAGIVAAAAACTAYAGLLAFGVRRVRRLASRFTPPLPLPGDIWRIGVAEPPRRSSNWPIRLFRKPPDGGVGLRRAA
jgi:hypothetical protein